MSKLYCIDIDDTISPSFFPNLGEKANIQEMKENILKTKLNPYFIQFYTRICNNDRVIFITGRRAKDFYFETIEQLEILDISPEQIIFYPDHLNHTKIQYKNFKIYNILAQSLRNKGLSVLVFDDHSEYFPKLLSLGLIFEIENMHVYHVKNIESFWKKRVEVSNLKQTSLINFEVLAK